MMVGCFSPPLEELERFGVGDDVVLELERACGRDVLRAVVRVGGDGSRVSRDGVAS